MKQLVMVISVLVGLVLIAFLVAGYFLGNVPVASALLGTNKPKDLGVKITTANVYAGLKDFRVPTTVKELEAIQKNPKSYTAVKTSLTQDEISSLLALGDIPDFPLRATQIKLGANGSIQASGVLDIEKLQKCLRAMGASGDVMDRVMGFVKTAKFINFYADGNLAITNNRLSGDIKSMKLGNIGVPDGLLQKNEASIRDFVSNSLSKGGYNIRKLTISEGKVDVDMHRPLGGEKNWLKFVQY
jgi:hypothetical protein